MVQNNAAERARLGPAERIIQTLINHDDHMVHNRPGVVTPDASKPCGARWDFATTKVEDDGHKYVYKVTKGKRPNIKVGRLWADNTIRVDRRKVAEYRPAGIFPEVAEWMYRQAIQVWDVDNEFAARWASFAFGEEHRDLKVVLAALMLVQARKGDPIREDGEVFHDEDFRDVGEAMCLLFRKDKRHLDAKMLLRVHDLLNEPKIAAINRERGFGRSQRRPFLGRWPKAVTRWLRYRESNLPLLQGLVKAGYKSSVRKLAQLVRYKPQSPEFFEVLGWKQGQAKDGHRTIALNVEMAKPETWEGLSEKQVCERIVADKPNFKRLTSLLPKGGLTRAIMAAAIESGCLSNKDLINLMPTIDDLGLLKVQEVRDKVDLAVQQAENMRATNIAKNVKSKAAKELLEKAEDNAVQTEVAKAMNNIRVYFFVDRSWSMANAIAEAMSYVEKFVHSFPLERLHVCTFNTVGREVTIRPTKEKDGLHYGSKASVRAAFRGIRADGGTSYGAAVLALQGHRPEPDEDVIFIFIGDEEDGPFVQQVRVSNLNPMAFGLVRVGNSRYTCVQDTARDLGIPCFQVKPDTFEDVYAIPRTIRNLVAATPVNQRVVRQAAPRVTLVDQILKTDLLTKPVWAAA